MVGEQLRSCRACLGELAGDENGRVASTTNITSALRSLVRSWLKSYPMTDTAQKERLVKPLADLGL